MVVHGNYAIVANITKGEEEGRPTGGIQSNCYRVITEIRLTSPMVRRKQWRLNAWAHWSVAPGPQKHACIVEKMW
jgi:hypothetical protein